MQYYLIPVKLALRLNLTQIRHGCAATGYVVTLPDLVGLSPTEAIDMGAKAITRSEAIVLINKLRYT